MSSSPVFPCQFNLLERIYTEIKAALSDQEPLLTVLFKPFSDSTLIKTQGDYHRLGEFALGSIETLDLEKCPLLARETLIRKAGESEMSTIHTGDRYRFKSIDRCVAGLYLFAGTAFWLSGDFRLAIETLKKVAEHADQGTDSSRFLLGLIYFFIGNKDEAAYFMNLSASSFSGNLLHRITFFSIKKDYARVKSLLESFSKDLARTLSLDPLLLYFYSDAVYRLRAFSLFEKTLKPLFDARFKEPQQYYFLHSHLESLYQKLMFGDRCPHEAFGAGEGSSSFQLNRKLIPLKRIVESVRAGTGGSPCPTEEDSEGGTPLCYSDSELEKSPFPDTPELDGLSLV
jgi:hypothetical protein